MATLNLNAEQLNSSNIGVVLGNLVYNLNNAAEQNVPHTKGTGVDFFLTN